MPFVPRSSSPACFPVAGSVSFKEKVALTGCTSAAISIAKVGKYILDNSIGSKIGFIAMVFEFLKLNALRDLMDNSGDIYDLKLR